MTDKHEDADISRLYRTSRNEEPPLRLDSAILREARKAVEKKPGWSPGRWLLPVTSVALVMLTATLVIQMRREQPQLLAPEPALERTAPSKGQGAEEGAVMQQREAPEDVDRAQPQANEAARQFLGKEEAGAAKARQPDEKRAASPAAAMPAAEPASEPELQPEDWLEHILELKRQGRDAEAADSLKRFRLAYPGHAIPEALHTD